MGKKLTKETFQPTKYFEVNKDGVYYSYNGWKFDFKLNFECSLNFFTEISFDVDIDKFNMIEIHFSFILFGIGPDLSFSIKKRK